MTKKRNLPAFLLALVLVLFTGCQKESVVYLELPFAADDVESVTAVYRENPSDAGQEKIVTERSAVEELYECFTTIPLRSSEAEQLDDVPVASFSFELSDGTEYEILYAGIAVKTGILCSEDGGFCYSCSSDLVGIWNRLNAGETAETES